MNAEMIDRRQVKADASELLRTAQVSPRVLITLHLGIALIFDLLVFLAPAEGLFSIFLPVLTSLITVVLGAGFVLCCMAFRRRERAEYLMLFDGFSFAGRIVSLQIVQTASILLWSMLFVIPGIIAAYRYRFALYNLYENPGLTPFEALDMSKQQTNGYKMQLLTLDLSYLGWSLLASLPTIAAEVFFYQDFLSSMGGSAFAGSALVSSEFFLSLGWMLFSSLWNVVVSIFYLPHYTCVLLEYFDTAKRTSGVKSNSLSQDDIWSSDNDDHNAF